MGVKFTESIYCIELGALTHYSLPQLLNFHLLLGYHREKVLNGRMGTVALTILRLRRLVKLRHKLACVLLLLLVHGHVLGCCRGAFRGSRLLPVIPYGLLYLRLSEATVLGTTSTTVIHLDVGVVVGAELLLLLVLFELVGGAAMDSILPALVKLGVFTAHVIVQNGRLLNGLERSA